MFASAVLAEKNKNAPPIPTECPDLRRPDWLRRGQAVAGLEEENRQLKHIVAEQMRREAVLVMQLEVGSELGARSE
jgi:hypothetical protein